jgi:hypothetical protein
VHKGFGVETREKRHLKDPGVDGRRILRWILKKVEMRAWTESICLRRSIDGGNF